MSILAEMRKVGNQILPLTFVQILQYEYIVRNRTASKKVVGSEANAGDLLPQYTIGMHYVHVK